MVNHYTNLNTNVIFWFTHFFAPLFCEIAPYFPPFIWRDAPFVNVAAMQSIEHCILQDRELMVQASVQARAAVTVEEEEAARRKERAQRMAKLATLAAGDSRHIR